MENEHGAQRTRTRDRRRGDRSWTLRPRMGMGMAPGPGALPILVVYSEQPSRHSVGAAHRRTDGRGARGGSKEAGQKVQDGCARDRPASRTWVLVF
jgi:hypothetical protein